MSAGAWIVFFVFAVVQFVMYIVIRRGLAAPALVGGVGVVSSVILMMLFSLSQSNPILQALLTGIAVGGLFSAATLGLAWFFSRAEADQAARASASAPIADE